MNIDNKIAYVFDWDGTLFDSMFIKRNNFIKLFYDQYSIDKISINDIHTKYSGMPRDYLFSIVNNKFNLKLSRQELENLSEKLSNLNKKALSTSKIYNDVNPLFKNLLKNNKFLFISSSVPQQELYYFVKMKISKKYYQNISAILGTRENFTKGTDHFKFIISNFDYSKKDILFIGDDIKDMELANSAYVDALCIDRDHRFNDKHDFKKIYSLKELQIGC